MSDVMHDGVVEAETRLFDSGRMPMPTLRVMREVRVIGGPNGPCAEEKISVVVYYVDDVQVTRNDYVAISQSIQAAATQLLTIQGRP